MKILETFIVNIISKINIKNIIDKRNKYLTIKNLIKLTRKYKIKYGFEFKNENDILENIYKSEILLNLYKCCVNEYCDSCLEDIGYNISYFKSPDGYFKICIDPKVQEIKMYCPFDNPTEFKKYLTDYITDLFKIYDRYMFKIELDKITYNNLIKSLENYEYFKYEQNLNNKKEEDYLNESLFD